MDFRTLVSALVLMMEAALVILMMKETEKPILLGERLELDQPLHPEILVVIQTGCSWWIS